LRPGIGRGDKCLAYSAARRVRGDCQFAYVSVDLAGEVVLLADGYHSGDAGLMDSDKDCSVLARGCGEGVDEPLAGCQDGDLAIPPGGEPFYQSRGELQDSWLVMLGCRANMDVCRIHVSIMPPGLSFVKAH
jgi:hypothetical protein